MSSVVAIRLEAYICRSFVFVVYIRTSTGVGRITRVWRSAPARHGVFFKVMRTVLFSLLWTEVCGAILGCRTFPLFPVVLNIDWG